MSDKLLIERILKGVGGQSNIKSLTNCMTRLRLTLHDKSKLDENFLKETEGVMGLNDPGADGIQVILGPGNAKRIADEISASYVTSTHSEGVKVDNNWQENKAAVKDRQVQSGFKNILNLIASIFIPLIPAIIAAGMFQGISSLLNTLIGQGTLSGDFWILFRMFFGLIGTSFLGYFAIFTGINAAKVFGATEALGGMVGAMSIAAPLVDLSTQLGLYNVDQPLNSILTTGKGGIIGVIFGVYLLSKVEKWVRKFIPAVLDIILTPVLSLLITALMFVFIIMPLSGLVSDWLVAFLNIFINSTNPIIAVISGFILSALFLPMVLLGLHHGLIPIYAIQLEKLGGVTLFPVLAMAGAGQVGACIAIYFMAKKKGYTKLQQVITGALPAGFLGIGEPLIYGVTLPLGKPFITAGIGAGFGGAYVMATHVMASAWGPSGLVAIPVMQPNSMLNYFVGLVIAYIAGFIVTRMILKPEEIREV